MRAQPKMLSRILQALRPLQSFCVVGHARPDGDCIGSQLALTLALRDQGKQVVCWNEDEVPEKLAFLDPHRLLQQPVRGQRFDCVIALDSANLDRLGKAAECVQHRDLLINIDHHKSNTLFGDLNWVEANEPSTGELIYRLLKAARWPITREIADCLFTAVSTDTGSFQYPSTRPGSYRVAGELVEHGANLARICDEVYQSYPLARVRLLKHLYNRFRLTHQNRIAYLWLKKADFARTGAKPSDAEGLIDHMRAIEPVVVACVFEEIEPELTRISLRSKSAHFNVSDIASLFGGGGHAAAAGARIRGRPLAVQRRVLGEIKRALNGAA